MALITGGSRGIGKKVAEKFAQKGYNLVINYVSDNTNIKELVQELKQEDNQEIMFIKADVTDFIACEQLVKQAIEKFGKIDVLVNNAGITKDNLLARMKEEEFDKVIEVNLKGTFNMTKNVVPFMMKKIW